MPSPDSGTRTRTVVSAMRATSSSLCPTPTVSMRMRSKPDGIEQVAHLARGGGEPAERAAASHRPDVDPRVERDGFHADAVAEQRAAGEGAGGIHGDDRHPQSGLRGRRRPGARRAWTCRRPAGR